MFCAMLPAMQAMDRNFLSLLYEDELESLLRCAITDPTTRPDFFELLIHAPVYVFRAGPSSPSLKSAPWREMLSVLSWKLSDGSVGIPFFTSLPALRRCQQGRANFFEVGASELIAFSGTHRLIVNSGSPETLEFHVDEMQQAQKVNETSAFKPVWIHRSSIYVLVAPFLEAPTRLIRSLEILCTCYKNIEAAFIAKIKYIPNDQKVGYVIGVIADTDINVATMAVQAVAQKHLLPHEYVELLGLDDSEPEMRNYFNKNIQPFYRHRSITSELSSDEPSMIKPMILPAWTSTISESIRRFVHWH